MMALQLKDDREIEKAVQGSQEALTENNIALDRLLECIYGVGGAGREELRRLIKKTGEDGKDNPKRL